MSAADASRLDDYLGLLQAPIDRLRLLLFHGASGSGKSSQIALLLDRHPELAGRRVHFATPACVPDQRQDVLVIDEIQTLRDTVCLGPALRHARLVLVASHVDPTLLWPWRWGRNGRCFRLDRLSHKLALELARRGVRHSPRALALFVDRFGANYTDLDIVLEQAGVDDLDLALALFLRGSRIRHG